MELYSRNDTMVRGCHLNSFVTAIMLGIVTLRGEFPDSSLCNIIVYRIVSVLLIGKDFIPELFPTFIN